MGGRGRERERGAEQLIICFPPVTQVMKKRKRKGETEYLVRWMDCASDEDTWESTAAVPSELVEQFEEAQTVRPVACVPSFLPFFPSSRQLSAFYSCVAARRRARRKRQQRKHQPPRRPPPLLASARLPQTAMTTRTPWWRTWTATCQPWRRRGRSARPARPARPG